MTRVLPVHRLATAEEMCGAIAGVLDQCHEAACQSQYDVMVCVRSVAAAREVFENVPVEGTAEVYGQRVSDALYALTHTFYDSDGEYTSKGMVGDAASDVYQLLKSQESDDIVAVDHDEARAVLIEEMAGLARLTPQPATGLETANIKTEGLGKSGVEYFVRMSFEETPDGKVTLIGTAHCTDTDRFPVARERLELTP